MRGWTTRQKLWGTLAAAWLAMLALMTVVVWIMRGSMFEERTAKVESQIDLVYSVLEYYSSKVEKGELRREDAQNLAAAQIKNMRYEGGRGYFFVFDFDLRLMAHPTLKVARGDSLVEFKDADGRRLFSEFAKAAQEGKGRGFVDYRWAHNNGTEIENKRSLIRTFEPWGWYVGSGIYLADIQDIFIRHLMEAVIGLMIAGVAVSLLMGWVIRDLLRTLGGDPRLAVEVVRHIADGDLSWPVALRPGDQVSVLANMSRMQEALRKIIGDIGQSARLVEAEAEAIGVGNSELATRTTQQAAALAETAATMEELTATVRQNAEHAERANSLASNCVENAHRGETAMQSVEEIMAAIQLSADRMSGIVDTIDAIAFQTNILALNASVEAARAGEQGRSFAVVAGEVRKLASRSAEAAGEIKNLIDGAASQVQAGNQQVRETGDMIRAMVTDISQLNTLIGEISAASAEQSNGIEQVNLAVSQMDQTTQSNAQMVQSSAQAAQRLNQQSTQLTQHVIRFVIDDSPAEEIPPSRSDDAGRPTLRRKAA